MPSKTQGDLVREHGEQLAVLIEKIENVAEVLELREDWVNQRFDHFQGDIDRLQKSFDKQGDRRWSLFTTLIGLGGAVLGALLTQLFRFFSSR